MPLESATYISGLNASNPVGVSDPKSQGDDHLRLIKSTLLNTFPGITGAVNATQTELNRLVGVTGVTGTGKLVLDTAPTIGGITTFTGIPNVNIASGIGGITLTSAQGGGNYSSYIQFIDGANIIGLRGVANGNDFRIALNGVEYFQHTTTGTRVGASTVNHNLTVNGLNSGTAGGAYLNVQNNGSTITALGNLSAIVGGAYNATTVWYNSGALQMLSGGSNVILSADAAGNVASAMPWTFTGAIIFDSATNTPILLRGTGSCYLPFIVGGATKGYFGSDGTDLVWLNSGATALMSLTQAGDLRLTASPTVLATNSAGFRGLGGVAEKGSNHTFVLGDAGQAVDCNDAGSITFTVPPQSSVAYPAHSVLCGTNHGSGTLTIARGSGVTFRDQVGTNADLTVPQYSKYYAERSSVDSNTWYVRVC